MKSVVLAGGNGRRLRPLTDPLNKHLLPVGGRPMIHLVLETLSIGGVDEALFLLNGKHPGLMLEMVGTGHEFGVDVTYRFTPEQRQGPGGHLPLARSFVGDEAFVVIAGDAFFSQPLDFRQPNVPHGWTMALDHADDPYKYWQVKTRSGYIVDVAGRPDPDFSDVIATAAWVFAPDAFDLAEALRAGGQGEVHVIDIAREYVRLGRMAHTTLPPGSYLDLGTPDALLEAGRRING